MGDARETCGGLSASERCDGRREAVSDGVSLSVAEPLLVAATDAVKLLDSVTVADVVSVAVELVVTDADGDEHITLPADEY